VKEKTATDLQAAENQVAQARATLEAARAGKLQVSMRDAEKLTAEEAVRQAEAVLALRRTNRTQDRVRQQEYQAAQAGVRQAEAALRQAEALHKFQQAQLEKAVIHSPISGVVLTITAQQGETIAAGFSAPTLITVADMGRLEVRAYVDETDIGHVRLGLPAEVRVEAFRDRVFHGRVTKTASASTIKDNVVTYETTIALDAAGGLLRPDMTADVTLVLGRRPDVLLVPAEALHRAVDRTLVYVLHRNKKDKQRVEEREVKAGISDASSTEIRSGLKDGEEVVLAGLPRLGVQAIDAQTTKPKRDGQK
jgi:RND family efflux transporter MFP subunit